MVFPGAFEIRNLGADGTRYQDDLRATGRARHFLRDREIFGHGHDANHVFKVEADVVRTYKFLRDGRRQVDAFMVSSAFGLEIGATYLASQLQPPAIV